MGTLQHVPDSGDDLDSEELIKSNNGVCNPMIVDVAEDEMDVATWFDISTINLLYISVKTLSKKETNNKLVDNISQFIVDLCDESIVEENILKAANKFKFNFLDLE